MDRRVQSYREKEEMKEDYVQHQGLNNTRAGLNQQSRPITEGRYMRREMLPTIPEEDRSWREPGARRKEMSSAQLQDEMNCKELCKLYGRVQELLQVVDDLNERTAYLQGCLQEKEACHKEWIQEKEGFFNRQADLLRDNEILQSEYLLRSEEAEAALSAKEASREAWEREKESILLDKDRLLQQMEAQQRDAALKKQELLQTAAMEKVKALEEREKRFSIELSRGEQQQEKVEASLILAKKLNRQLHQWQGEKARVLQENAQKKLAFLQAREEIESLKRSREEDELRWASLLRQKEEERRLPASDPKAEKKRQKELAKQEKEQQKLQAKKEKEERKRLAKLEKEEKKKEKEERKRLAKLEKEEKKKEKEEKISWPQRRQRESASCESLDSTSWESLVSFTILC